MTVANHAPALRAPSLAAALGALRARGMRVSLARRVAPRRLDAARELIEREFGFIARFTHFPIVGLCAYCKEQHAHS